MRYDPRLSGWMSHTPWFVLALLIFVLGSVAAFGQDEVSLDEPTQGLANRLLIIIVAAIIALISRAVLLRRLNKLMLSASKKAEGFEPASPIKETRARQSLNLVEKNIESQFPEEGSRRANLMAQARKGINQHFLIHMILVAAYAAGFAFVVSEEFPLYLQSLASGSEDIEAIRRPILNFQIYEWLIKFYFLWTVVQFLANRYYFSAWSKGRFGFLAQGFWGEALSILVLIYTLFFALTLPTPLILASVALHLVLRWHLKRSGRKRSNTKLLILRVFLLKKTSDFTFNGLVKAWKHFGNYFTAADPSFYKVTWKRGFRHTFPVYILVVFFIYTFLEDITRGSDVEALAGIFIAFLIIGNFIFIMNSRSRMKLKFMGSPESLAKRLGIVERQPTKADNTFRELPVMCYDNTWRQAVDGMIGAADVVLMDLRGFSEKNISSAWEINVLFDSVPTNRIVFMTYEDAVPLVKRVIEQQWEMLAENSPNLNTENPYTTLYTVTRENRKEMQGILATLLDASGSDAR